VERRNLRGETRLRLLCDEQGKNKTAEAGDSYDAFHQLVPRTTISWMSNFASVQRNRQTCATKNNILMLIFSSYTSHSFSVTSMSRNRNNLLPVIYNNTQSNNLPNEEVLTPISSAGIALVRSRFPGKLRQLLDDSERQGNQHIVSWLSHGRAFKVHDPREFASKIVGRYFNHGNYRSFTRQVSEVFKTQVVNIGITKDSISRTSFTSHSILL
jgi:HSF-type DNA-binding